MKATFDSQYKNSKGTTMFRYIVSGTAEELSQYQEIKGEYFRANDEGHPLYFSQTYFGESAELKVSSKGNLYPDTSETDKILSFAKAQGIDVGKQIAEDLMAKLVGKRQVIEEQKVSGDGLDKM